MKRWRGVDSALAAPPVAETQTRRNTTVDGLNLKQHHAIAEHYLEEHNTRTEFENARRYKVIFAEPRQVTRKKKT